MRRLLLGLALGLYMSAALVRGAIGAIGRAVDP